MTCQLYDKKVLNLSPEVIQGLSVGDAKAALRRLGVEWVPSPDSPLVRQTAQVRECLRLLAGAYRAGSENGISHRDLLAAIGRVMVICGGGVAKGAATSSITAPAEPTEFLARSTVHGAHW